MITPTHTTRSKLRHRGMCAALASVIMTVTACAVSGSESANEPSTTPEGPPSAEAYGPRAPEQKPELSSIDMRGLVGQGRDGTLNDLSRVGRRRIATGEVALQRQDIRKPLVLESERTGDWKETPVEMPRDATDATAITAMASPAGPVVAGTVWHDNGSDGAIWRRRAGEWRSENITGDLAGEGSQVVNDAAAGGAGLVAIGLDDGHAALWTSSDGRRWQIPQIHVGSDRLALLDVAVSDHAMLVVASTSEQTMLLHSTDGTEFTIAHNGQSDGPIFTSVVAHEDEFAVAGGVRSKDGIAPAVWRTDGKSWPGDVERLPRSSNASSRNETTVSSLAYTRGQQLLAFTEGSLVRSAEPGTWNRLVDESLSGSPGVDALVSRSDGRVEVLVGDAMWITAAGAWESSTPAALPSPGRQVSVSSVAHHRGTWVAAADVADTDDGERTVVWRSTDGETWERASYLPQPGGTKSVLGTSKDGFALMNWDAGDKAMNLWTSPDGATWVRQASSLLVQPDGVDIELGQMVTTPDGFAVNGARWQGAWNPWLLVHDDTGTTLHDGLPDLADEPSAYPGANCSRDGDVALASVGQSRTAGVGWWTRDNDGWTAHTADELTSFVTDCVEVDDRLLAVGARHDSDAVVLDLASDDPVVAALPGSPNIDAHTIDVVGDRLVVAGSYRLDGSPRVWVSNGLDGGEWEQISGEQLPEGEAQRVVDVAAGDNGDAVLAIVDGASSRLVRVQLPGQSSPTGSSPPEPAPPLEEIVETTCGQLRTEGYETRKRALDLARADFGKLRLDGDLRRHLRRDCPETLEGTNAARALEDDAVALSERLREAYEPLVGAGACADGRITTTFANPLDVALGVNLGLHTLDQDGDIIQSVDRPLVAWNVEAGEEVEFEAGCPDDVDLTTQRIGLWPAPFVVDSSDAGAERRRPGSGPPTRGDQPSEWLPALVRAERRASRTVNADAAADLIDVRSPQYTEMQSIAAGLVDRGPVNDVAVCERSIERPSQDLVSFVYYVEHGPLAAEEAFRGEPVEPDAYLRVGTFRRGTDGRWRWLSYQPFDHPAYYDCGQPR